MCAPFACSLPLVAAPGVRGVVADYPVGVPPAAQGATVRRVGSVRPDPLPAVAVVASVRRPGEEPAPIRPVLIAPGAGAVVAVVSAEADSDSETRFVADRAASDRDRPSPPFDGSLLLEVVLPRLAGIPLAFELRHARPERGKLRLGLVGHDGLLVALPILPRLGHGERLLESGDLRPHLGLLGVDGLRGRPGIPRGRDALLVRRDLLLVPPHGLLDRGTAAGSEERGRESRENDVMLQGTAP